MSANEEIPTREESISKIADLIKGIRIAMLTTVNIDGSLHSRPMATQDSAFTGDVLFLTREHSGKVDEIRHDAEVSLCYTDAKHAFVTLTGRASITNDRALIGALWNPMYKAWFTEGETDPEIRVLRVHVEQAEYWDAPASSIVRTAQVLARAATGGKTPVGDHARVSL